MLTRCAVAVSSFPKGAPSAPTAVYKTLFTIKPMQTGAFASQKQKDLQAEGKMVSRACIHQEML